ncbi:hypothetical protein C0993_004506, partial [Termitomyces sp. T159_Od127]
MTSEDSDTFDILEHNIIDSNVPNQLKQLQEIEVSKDACNSLGDLGANTPRHAKRCRQRDTIIEDLGHAPSAHTLEKTVQLAEPLNIDFSSTKFPVARGGYTAQNANFSEAEAKKVYTEEELVNKHGFKVYDWDE